MLVQEAGVGPWAVEINAAMRAFDLAEYIPDIKDLLACVQQPGGLTEEGWRALVECYMEVCEEYNVYQQAASRKSRLTGYVLSGGRVDRQFMCGAR